MEAGLGYATIHAPSARAMPSSRSSLTTSLLTVTLLAGLSGACAEPSGPSGLESTPFEPPPGYRILWAEVEGCSGRAGDPVRVLWMKADSFPGRPLRLAQWEPEHVITLRADMEVALPVLSHEILHDLLGGDGAHEDPAWLECALPVAGAGSGR